MTKRSASSSCVTSAANWPAKALRRRRWLPFPRSVPARRRLQTKLRLHDLSQHFAGENLRPALSDGVFRLARRYAAVQGNETGRRVERGNPGCSDPVFSTSAGHSCRLAGRQFPAIVFSLLYGGTHLGGFQLCPARFGSRLCGGSAPRPPPSG